MVALPFVVQPRRQPIIERIGSEDSGILEVERRGYLTTGEKSFFQQVQQSDGSTSGLITLSRRVARQYGMGMDAAYQAVLGVISGSSSEDEEQEALFRRIDDDFADDLTRAVSEMAAGQLREDMVMAVCIMKYRVNPDFETGDVVTLHPDLISGLAALYRDEEARSIEAFTAREMPEDEAVDTSVEVVEKKPVKAKPSRSTSTTGD